MTVPGFDGFGDGWITDPADPRLVVLWPGSVDYPAADLGFPLWIARIQCERFAPAPPVTDPPVETVVPENYVAAQILQARALVRAGYTGDNNGAGGYEETVTVFPMDWAVKNLLRPRKGKPYFGGNRATLEWTW